MEWGTSIPPTSAFFIDWKGNPKEENLYTNAGFDNYFIVISPKEENGVTVADFSKEDFELVLNRCDAIGLEVRIRLHSRLIRPGYNVFTEAFANVDFTEYSCFKGFFLVDEPSWTQLDVLEDVYVPWFNNLVQTTGQDYEFFVNLLSGYSTAIGGLRDINGNLVTNNGKYYCSNGLWDGIEGYAVKDGRVTNEKVAMVLTEQEKRDFVTAYHNKWLGIFAKVNSVNKYFSHDAYPFFDNQKGKINLVNPNSTADELAAAQENAVKYEANTQLGLMANDFLTETPADYEYWVKDEWLSRSLNIAILAKNNGYKYGAHIQVFDEGGVNRSDLNWRLPTTLAEVRWQVYMNLAMGAKRMDYFAFSQTKGGSYMIVGVDPLPNYYFVQQTNAELSRVEHVFAAFETWVGVKTFAASGKSLSAGLQMVVDKGQNLDSLTNVKSVSTSGELVVGEMVDGEGNHGYMLVGYDDPLNGNSTEVQMTFDGALGFIVYRGGERTLVEAVDGAYSATLAAGEGVFVIPVYMD